MQTRSDGHGDLNGAGGNADRSAAAPERRKRPAGGGGAAKSATAGRHGAGKRTTSGMTATTARLASTMADAGMVQARLLRAIDRQARLVDARLTGGEASIDERDARILGHLAKSLGTLMEIGEGGRTSKDREPPDRDDAEDRLAERIKKWARGGE